MSSNFNTVNCLICSMPIQAGYYMKHMQEAHNQDGTPRLGNGEYLSTGNNPRPWVLPSAADIQFVKVDDYNNLVARVEQLERTVLELLRNQGHFITNVEIVCNNGK